MVTINYEPLEHLPHIDENISPEERSHVEQLIRLELANQFNNNIQHITHNDENMANPNIIVEQQQQQEPQQQSENQFSGQKQSSSKSKNGCCVIV